MRLGDALEAIPRLAQVPLPLSGRGMPHMLQYLGREQSPHAPPLYKILSPAVRRRRHDQKVKSRQQKVGPRSTFLFSYLANVVEF